MLKARIFAVTTALNVELDTPCCALRQPCRSRVAAPYHSSSLSLQQPRTVCPSAAALRQEAAPFASRILTPLRHLQLAAQGSSLSTRGVAGSVTGSVAGSTAGSVAGSTAGSIAGSIACRVILQLSPFQQALEGLGVHIIPDGAC